MENILRVLNNLQCSDERLAGKAREFFHSMNMKMPIGFLKKAEVARPAIAVEFALRELRINYDRNQIIESAMISSKEYQSNFIKCKNVLQLQFINGNLLDILTVKCGNSSLKDIVLKIKELYAERVITNVNEFQQKFIDLNSPVYEAAAFRLACKIANIPFDRKGVLLLCDIDGQYFDRIYAAISNCINTETDFQETYSLKEVRQESTDVSQKLSEQQTGSKKRTLPQLNDHRIAKSATRTYLGKENPVPSGIFARPTNSLLQSFISQQSGVSTKPVSDSCKVMAEEAPCDLLILQDSRQRDLQKQAEAELREQKKKENYLKFRERKLKNFVSDKISP